MMDLILTQTIIVEVMKMKDDKTKRKDLNMMRKTINLTMQQKLMIIMSQQGVKDRKDGFQKWIMLCLIGKE